MAVSTLIAVIEYELDGVTAVYSVPYQFFDADHLVVTYGDVGTETTLARGADYTVAARPSTLPATGSITLLDPASLTGVLRILRQTPRTQSLAQTQTGAQDAAAQVRAWDRDMLIEQEQDQTAADGVAVSGEFVHGNLAGGDLHDLATDDAAGFMSAAEHTSLADLVAGDDTTYVLSEDTLTEGTTLDDVILRNNSGTGRGPFTWSIGGAYFNGTWDPVHVLGYNYTPSGTLVVAGEPAMGFFQEGDYDTGANNYIEQYFQWKLADGTTTGRPVFSQTDRATGDTAVVLEAFGSLGYISLNAGATGDTQIMKILTDGIQMPTATAYFKFTASGAKTILEHNNFAGSGTVHTILVDASDGLWFGGDATVPARIYMGQTTEILGSSSSGWQEGAKITAGANADDSGVQVNLTPRSLSWGGHLRAGRWLTGDRGLRITSLNSGGNARGYIHMNAEGDSLELVNYAGGSNLTRIKTDATGIGFYATAPVAKQTITGPVGSTLASNSIATALATIGIFTNSTTGALGAPAYSASITFDASASTSFPVTATDGSAFTINAPTSPTTGQRISVRIRNNSGGALGTATWNAAFKMDTWVQPATGFSRAIDFEYDATNWVEISRTPADVPL